MPVCRGQELDRYDGHSGCGNLSGPLAGRRSEGVAGTSDVATEVAKERRRRVPSSSAAFR